MRVISSQHCNVDFNDVFSVLCVDAFMHKCMTPPSHLRWKQPASTRQFWVQSYSCRALIAGASLAHRAVVPWLGTCSALVAQVLYISPWPPGILGNAAGLAILPATRALCSAVCVLRGDLAVIVAGWDERVLDHT